jgi:hypothetical protein
VRALLEFAGAVLATAALGLGYLAWRGLADGRDARARGRARWAVHERGEAGAMVVAVVLATPSGRPLDEHIVARIPDDDADWSATLLAARGEAAERAFHLNAGWNLPG